MPEPQGGDPHDFLAGASPRCVRIVGIDYGPCDLPDRHPVHGSGRVRDTDGDREPQTEAGRILLQEHSSGTPHMARHILAIEAEAGRLDVERLTVALWGLDGASVDARKLAEQIIAEYERIGPMP